jgi:hypothetical protein
MFGCLNVWMSVLVDSRPQRDLLLFLKLFLECFCGLFDGRIDWDFLEMWRTFGSFFRPQASTLNLQTNKVECCSTFVNRDNQSLTPACSSSQSILPLYFHPSTLHFLNINFLSRVTYKNLFVDFVIFMKFLIFTTF